jgi:hypothetical protein
MVPAKVSPLWGCVESDINDPMAHAMGYRSFAAPRLIAFLSKRQNRIPTPSFHLMLCRFNIFQRPAQPNKQRGGAQLRDHAENH